MFKYIVLSLAFLVLPIHSNANAAVESTTHKVAGCPCWVCGCHPHKPDGKCPIGQYMGPDGMCHSS